MLTTNWYCWKAALRVRQWISRSKSLWPRRRFDPWQSSVRGVVGLYFSTGYGLRPKICLIFHNIHHTNQIHMILDFWPSTILLGVRSSRRGCLGKFAHIKLVTAGKRCRPALTSRIPGQSIYGKLLVLWWWYLFCVEASWKWQVSLIENSDASCFQIKFKYSQALVLTHQLLHYFINCFHCLLIPFNFSLIFRTLLLWLP